MENQPQSSEHQPKPLFAEAVKSISQNSRAQKLLHLLLEDTLPPDEELNLTNTRAHVAELRSTYPTTQEIILDLVDTIDNTISIPHDPQLSQEEHTQAVKEKKDQYRQALQDIIQALEPVYQEFGASEKSHEQTVDVLTEKVTKHTVEGEELSDFDFQRMHNLVLSLDPQSLTNHQRKGDQRTLVLNSYNVLPEEYKTQEIEEIITEVKDSLENTSQETSSEQEPQSSFEIENTKEENLTEFIHYVENSRIIHLIHKFNRPEHKQYIESLCYDFYRNEHPPLSPENLTDEKLSQLSKTYNQLISYGKDKIENLPTKPSIHLQEQGGWMYSQIESGHDNTQPFDRVYLNVDPMKVSRIFLELNEQFSQKHIPCELKISNGGEKYDHLFRSDKIVVYANKESMNQIIDIIASIHSSYETDFQEQTPHFTDNIISSETGHKFSGIGVGEEPYNNEGQSFGGVRSKILAELTHKAYEHNPSQLFQDPSFPLDEAFANICKKYHVDPDNPAYNSIPSNV